MWKLSFTGSLNMSIQIGDNVYNAGSSNQVTGETFQTTDLAVDAASVYQSGLLLLGTVQDIVSNSTGYDIIIKPNDTAIPPNSGLYIFFGKNHEANTTSIKGYYNSIKFENNSTKKAELFAATCAIEASSK